MDLEFPRAMGDQVEKTWKFQGVGRVMRSPLEGKIQWGGGSSWKKPSVRGYGYFLEPHNENNENIYNLELTCYFQITYVLYSTLFLLNPSHMKQERVGMEKMALGKSESY